MLKKIALLLFVAVMPLFAMAQDVKLGYVNSQDIIGLMPELNDLEKQMAEFNEKNTKYLQEMQKEIEAKMVKYEQEKDTMTPAIKAVQEEELQNLYQRFQTAQQTLYQETQAQQMKLLQPLQTKFQNAVDVVAKRMNLTFVFDLATQSVLYKGNNAVDITSAVKKELGIF